MFPSKVRASWEKTEKGEGCWNLRSGLRIREIEAQETLVHEQLILAEIPTRFKIDLWRWRSLLRGQCALTNETLGLKIAEKQKRGGDPPLANKSNIFQIERNKNENRHAFNSESKKKAATISAATNETLGQEDRRKAKARGGIPPRRKDQRFFKSSGTTTKTDTLSAAKAKRRLPL